MKKFLSIIASFGCFFSIWANPDFAKPDFAFPQTVITDADSVLRTTNNGITRFKAVMEIVQARVSITPDSIMPVMDFVSAWAEKEKDPALQALYRLYEFKLRNDWSDVLRDLNKLMNKNEDIPEDSISLSAILQDINMWGAQPLSDYREIITIQEKNVPFFTKLRDFVFKTLISLKPEDRENLIARAFSLTKPGTPEWAYWLCLSNIKFDELHDYYNNYPKGITGGYILYSLAKRSSGRHDTEMVELIRNYLADNSQNVMTETLQSTLLRLTAPTLRVVAPEAVAPGYDFDVKCIHSYLSHFTLEIYKNYDIFNNKSEKKKIASYDVDVSPDAVGDTAIVTMTIKNPGNYEIHVVSDDFKDKYMPYSNITVTNWLTFGVNLGNNFVFAVADFIGGNPVSNASLYLSNAYRSNDNLKPLTGVSDADGIVMLQYKNAKEVNGGYITLSKGSSKVQFRDNISKHSFYNNTYYAGGIFVSRPLYHPGDLLDWSAVIVEKTQEEPYVKLRDSNNYIVGFFDANSQIIDEIEVKADDFGRIEGQFNVPTDRLTGYYSIRVIKADGNRSYICSASVMVSDFRMPVFEVKDLKVCQNDSAYVVTGRAMRYTGTAVPDASVDVTLRQAPMWLWRFYNNDIPEIKASGKTNPDGTFIVSVPAIKSIPGNGINFICDAIVTSVNADIATASTSFRVGKPNFLVGNISNKEVDAAVPVNLSVNTYGTDLRFAPVNLIWKLSVDGNVSYSDTFRSDSTGLRLNWSSVAAGKYNLRIEPVDTAICNSLDMGEIWIYNTFKNELPADLRLVVPTTSVNDACGDAVDVAFGVGNDAYVYIFGVEKDESISVKSEKFSAGFHTVSVPIGPYDFQKLAFVVFSEGQIYSKYVAVSRPKPDQSLIIKGESWRNGLVPGKEEKWTFTLTDPSGAPVSATMTATLYNAALNALEPNMSWPNMNALLRLPQKSAFQSFVSTQFFSGEFFLQANRPYSTYNLGSLKFAYYPENIFIRPELLGAMDKSARAQSVNDMAGSIEMAMEEESSVTADDAVETATQQSDTNHGFEYRDGERLWILWQPNIYTDNEGQCHIEFMMPNSIGSFTFRASAWTKDLRSASILSTLVASKPVMVEPSLPRFMRRGDNACVGATVINNTDSTSVITTVVELFNPSDNAVISSRSFESTLEAHGQDVVYVNVDASVSLDAIGYRVRSSCTTFTDGEQDIIPVLDSSTIAIDSDVFYLDNDLKTFTTTIPADESGDGIVAIQYCQNPVWDAVKALPGLYDLKPTTSTSAAASAYAALTAQGLYRKYPEICDVLNLWRSNPADSVLVSNLMKNEDLKLASLARTPFVGAANANTTQMERLASTFDAAVIRKVLGNATDCLESFQNSDGGFSWGSWSKESAPWITRTILSVLGRVKDKSLLENYKRLSRIIDRAFAYVDANVKATVDVSYTHLYSLYPGRKPSTQSGVACIDATVQNIIKNWKGHSTSQKATDALILYAFGHRASAGEIIESISQFAQTSPRRGVVFPSVTFVDDYVALLRAFAEISPQSPLLDGMRKWLVLRTQATDDLGAWNPTMLVDALVTTGTRWTANATSETADVSVDGRPLTLNRIEAATGAFSERLKPSSSRRAITFTCPEGTVAAYGSVTTVSTMPMAEVKARPGNGLILKKTLYALRNGKWVETDQLVFGEQVRVEIILDVKNVMEYVMISDQRAAGLEPIEQLPGWVNAGKASFYREVNDTQTNLFANRLNPGIYTIEYDAVAAFSGSFTSGTATVQSQYQPSLTARSGASVVSIR